MKKLLWIITSIIIALLIWEAYARVANIVLFPPPSAVLGTLVSLVGRAELYSHLGASILLVTVGYLISVALALPMALICARTDVVPKLTLPWHGFIRYIPVAAFVPPLTALIGIGDSTKIALIFIGTYFQVLFLYIADVSTIEPEFEDGARTLGVRGPELLFRIVLPASLPRLLDSSRVTFAWAWSYLLVAEVINSTRGIGYLVLQAYRVLNMERLFALLAIIGIFGVCADFLFRLMRLRACPWLEGNE